MEKELAKRSHFCNKVIQKYQDQIKNLEVQLLELRRGDGGEGEREAEEKAKDSRELGGFLERRINEIEMKLKAA